MAKAKATTQNKTAELFMLLALAAEYGRLNWVAQKLMDDKLWQWRLRPIASDDKDDDARHGLFELLAKAAAEGKLKWVAQKLMDDKLWEWRRGTRFVGLIASDDKDDDAPHDLFELLAKAAAEGKLKPLAVRLLELHRGTPTETER